MGSRLEVSGMRLRHGSFLLSITHSFWGLYAGCNSFFRIYESLPLELKTVQLCLTRTDSLTDYLLEKASTGLRMRLTTCAEESSRWQDQNKTERKTRQYFSQTPPSQPSNVKKDGKSKMKVHLHQPSGVAITLHMPTGFEQPS